MKKTQKAAIKVLAFIAQNPEKHNQESWVSDVHLVADTHNICGTTMCLAGAAVYVEGGTKALVNTYRDWGLTFPEEGARILGLTPPERESLFYTMNNETAVEALSALALGKRKKFRRILNLG